MAKARIVARSSDAATDRQMMEMLRALNNVTIRPSDRDLDADGSPAHDTAPEQMDGRYVRVVSAGPGVEVEVKHGLGRVPVGFLEVGRSHPALLVGLPNDPTVNRAWTKTIVRFVTQAPKGSRYKILLL